MIRLFMAVPVVSWILFAVLWFRGVEFRIAFVLIASGRPVFLIDAFDAMRNVPREIASPWCARFGRPRCNTSAS